MPQKCARQKLRRHHRQRESEDRALLLDGSEGNLPAHLLDQHTGEKQPEPGADDPFRPGSRGAEELLKDAVLPIFRNPKAGIFHLANHL